MDDGEVQHVQTLHDHALAVRLLEEAVALLHVDERGHLAVHPCQIVALTVHIENMGASGEVGGTVGFEYTVTEMQF